MLKAVLLQNKEMFLSVCHFRDRKNFFFFYQPRHYIAVSFLLIAFAEKACLNMHSKVFGTAEVFICPAA